MVSLLIDLDENKAFYNTRQLDELLQFAQMWLSRDYILRALFGEKKSVLWFWGSGAKEEAGFACSSRGVGVRDRDI